MDIENIERAIVKTIIQDALDLGYTVIHNDGEEVTSRAEPQYDREKTIVEMMDNIRHCDEEYLTIGKNGKRIGGIFLVYGNDGYDVICDHTDNEEMTEILAGANKLAETFEQNLLQ